MRFGLLALLAITVLFVGGALFVKYKLEGLRSAAQREVESRTGARLRVGAVTVHGLRGLRIDGLEVTLGDVPGATLRFTTPTAYVYPDLGDLLNGVVTVNRIEMDRSRIRVTRTPGVPWFGGDVPRSEVMAPLAGAAPFRIVGKDCELEVVNLVGDTRLDVCAVSFDVSRLSDSTDLAAKIVGYLAPDAAKPVKVDLRFTSVEDFDLRVHCGALTNDDIALLFPDARRILESGTVSPSLRVAGYPGKTLVVAFETPFDEVALRGQPDFLRPLTGVLSGVAQYDMGRRLISLTAAKADSDQLAGRIDGTVSFAQDRPQFDLRLVTTRLPVADVLSYVMEQRPEEFGALDLTLDEPCEVMASLKGTMDAPVFSFQGNAASGTFSFEPKDPSNPRATLTLGAVSVSWSPDQPVPVGSFVVTDGTLFHEASGLRAEHVTGTLSAENKRVHIEPLNAEIKGRPFVGSMTYDYEKGRLELALNGTISDIENTRIGAYTGDLDISGALGFRGNLVKDKRGYTLEGDVDATQARIAYPGWFIKPVGLGANVRNVHAEIVARRPVTLTAGVELAGARIRLKADLATDIRQWRLKSVEAACDKFDVGSAGMCLDIAYHVIGGVGTAAAFSWRRGDGEDKSWTVSGGLNVDRASLHPQDNDVTTDLEGVRVDMTMNEGERPEGKLKVHVRKATVPPLRTKWLIPLRPNNPSERKWTCDLSADTLDLPPWRGTSFSGQAFWNAAESGFSSFGADLDGEGHIQGTYKNNKPDNAYDLACQWKEIQAWYLLDQLNCPRVLTGKTTGETKYFLDRDDPSTLKGTGRFDVHDGHFSADFILAQLEGGLDKKITALPPSLKFASLGSDIVFQGDTITTPNLQLVSEGVKIGVNGSYVMHGDLDYELKVAVAPNMAERIPALRDNFRIQGLRLAQQDIEFAFSVKGPGFNPKGEVAEMPSLGITLVSSALEATSDAIHVIDIPRKILTDLFRIGGGIVGVTK